MPVCILTDQWPLHCNLVAVKIPNAVSCTNINVPAGIQWRLVSLLPIDLVQTADQNILHRLPQLECMDNCEHFFLPEAASFICSPSFVVPLQLVSRLLTARAVQRMLLQLQETDIGLFTWLSQFCSDNPPMEGDLVIFLILETCALDRLSKWIAYGRVNRTGLAHLIVGNNWPSRLVTLLDPLANRLRHGTRSY